MEKRSRISSYSVADVEATNWINTLMIGHFDGMTYRPFFNLADFIDYVCNHPDDLIFCHYGGKYDFQFVMQEALENLNYQFRIENIIPRGSGMLCFDLIVVRENEPDKKIRFSDSSALLPMGLEKITKGFNVEHKKLAGEIDFDKMNKMTPVQIAEIMPKLIHYNEWDCRGLWESLEKFFRWPLVEKAGNALTIASQSMKIFRLFMKKPFFSLPEKVDAFVRDGYFGGRTEVFKPIHKGEKLYYYDVNSLYPFIMRNNEMPGEFSHETCDYDTNEMAFLHCRVSVPDCFIPPLPVKHNGKLIFPVGEFEGIWSTEELRNAQKNGVKILEVISGRAFHKRGFIFREFIDELWEIKSRSEKGSVDFELSKLIMNGNFGRWGLRLDRENLVFDEFNEELEEYREIELKNGDKVMLSKKKVKLRAFTNVAVSAWITSLARVHLYNLFKKAGEDIFYCDTDSLFTRKKLKTGKKLGDLKLEDTISEACFLLPKTYTFTNSAGDTKTTMKGFPKKKVQHFEFEDFRLALAGDLKRLSIDTEPRFATLKTALQKRCLLMTTKPSKRGIKSLYNKRLFVKKENQWSSIPIKLKTERVSDVSQDN